MGAWTSFPFSFQGLSINPFACRFRFSRWEVSLFSWEFGISQWNCIGLGVYLCILVENRAIGWCRSFDRPIPILIWFRLMIYFPLSFEDCTLSMEWLWLRVSYVRWQRIELLVDAILPLCHTRYVLYCSYKAWLSKFVQPSGHDDWFWCMPRTAWNYFKSLLLSRSVTIWRIQARIYLNLLLQQ